MTNTEKILEEFDEIFPTFNGGKKAIRGLVKSFLTTKIAQAIAEDRERVGGEIEKFRTKLEWAGIQTSPESDQRKEYIKLDKYLDDLLSSLDKPLTDNKEDNG